MDTGLTGLAIKQKGVLRLQVAEKVSEFSTEVDNNINAPSVRSMMIGPLFNKSNQVTGVIQLINKLEDNPITDLEAEEFATLLPTIA